MARENRQRARLDASHIEQVAHFRDLPGPTRLPDLTAYVRSLGFSLDRLLPCKTFQCTHHPTTTHTRPSSRCCGAAALRRGRLVQTIDRFLEDAVRRFEERSALSFKAGFRYLHWSYRDAWEGAGHVASPKGDRVIIREPNSLHESVLVQSAGSLTGHPAPVGHYCAARDE